MVAGFLDALQDVLDDGAAQMEMVADERMFDAALSGTFAATAQNLYRMVVTLEKLADDIAKAPGYPNLAVSRPITPTKGRGSSNRA
jgi:hypothetical protein